MAAMRVVSYNVLADAYIRQSYYPSSPPEVFEPGRRRAAVVARLAGLSADVACLQEADAALLSRLPQEDLRIAYKRRRPDAVAVLTRRRVLHEQTVVFSDGSGHVALLVVLEDEGRRLGIGVTHIKWDPPGQTAGVAQVEEILTAIDGVACDGWILTGDFNAPPDSPHVGCVLARGWRDAYAGVTPADTCNAQRVPKRIDYLLHTPSLVAEPEPLAAIVSTTPLPSATEPSDHLPIMATFRTRPLP